MFNGMEGALTFRKGRAIVQLTFSEKDEPDGPPARRLRVLGPVAAAVADRMDRF